MAASYGIIVAATNSTMAAMEERTQSLRIVAAMEEGVEERSYDQSVAATECAMAAMEQTMEERSYRTINGRN